MSRELIVFSEQTADMSYRESSASFAVLHNLVTMEAGSLAGRLALNDTLFKLSSVITHRIKLCVLYSSIKCCYFKVFQWESFTADFQPANFQVIQRCQILAGTKEYSSLAPKFACTCTLQK